MRVGARSKSSTAAPALFHDHVSRLRFAALLRFPDRPHDCFPGHAFAFAGRFDPANDLALAGDLKGLTALDLVENRAGFLT